MWRKADCGWCLLGVLGPEWHLTLILCCFHLHWESPVTFYSISLPCSAYNIPTAFSCDFPSPTALVQFPRRSFAGFLWSSKRPRRGIQPLSISQQPLPHLGSLLLEAPSETPSCWWLGVPHSSSPAVFALLACPSWLYGFDYRATSYMQTVTISWQQPDYFLWITVFKFPFFLNSKNGKPEQDMVAHAYKP